MSVPPTSGLPPHEPDELGSYPAFPGGNGPDEIAYDDGEPSHGRSYLPWLIGVVVLAVGAGGLFALQAALGGGGDQPASVMPADVAVYGRLDADPSAGQKIQALRLANKIPAFRDNVDLTDLNADLRKSMFELIQGESPEVAELDYETDIEPWLGNRIGFGLTGASGDEEPAVMLALQVTDTERAEAGLDKLMAAGDGGGYVITGDYALISDTREMAQSFADAAAESSLADDADFKADQQRLGDAGIASMWVSEDATESLLDYPGVSEELGLVAGSGSLGAQAGSQAYAIRFGDRYVEVAGVRRESGLPASASGGTDPASRLPDSTLLAMSVVDGRQAITSAWDSLTESLAAADETFDREIKRFERQTGLSLPDDLGTLLGDGFAFAVDDQDFAALADPSDLRIGALLDTDSDAAQEVLDKLMAIVPSLQEFELARVESDGLLAVSPSKAYADTLAGDGGSLADTESYQLAVGDDDSAGSMFVNMDLLEGAITGLLDQFGADEDVLENLQPLQAFGVSASVDGDGVLHSSTRLVFND
jgi:hypothetical protein